MVLGGGRTMKRVQPGGASFQLQQRRESWRRIKTRELLGVALGWCDSWGRNTGGFGGERAQIGACKKRCRARGNRGRELVTGEGEALAREQVDLGGLRSQQGRQIS